MSIAASPCAEFPFEEVQWYSWTGEGWSSLGHDRSSISFQPVPFLAAFGDRVAQCCRCDWIEQDCPLFAVVVAEMEVEPVAAGTGIKGHNDKTGDQPFRPRLLRPLLQHVSFPALKVGTRVGGDRSAVLGHDSVHSVFSSIEAAA